MKNDRMTITDVAARIGVNPKTIMRWEQSGKVNPAKRDWRGWRVYDKKDLKILKDFKESITYYYENTTENGNVNGDGDGNGKNG